MLYQFQHFGTSESFRKEEGEDFSFPLHLHNSFELITLLSGEMTVTVEDRAYDVHPGEGVLVFPNQPHSLLGRSCRHILCIFSPELVSAYTKRREGLVPKKNLFSLSEYLTEEFLRIDEKEPTFAKKGFLYSVCTRFDLGAVWRTRAEGKGELLYRIFEYVEKHYAEECSLAALASALSFDYSYVSRLFKQATGISYNDYVNSYRISRACALLTQSSATVLSCAMEVGYRSLRSFNRNFKEYTSLTPTEYVQAQKESK